MLLFFFWTGSVFSRTSNHFTWLLTSLESESKNSSSPGTEHQEPDHIVHCAEGGCVSPGLRSGAYLPPVTAGPPCCRENTNRFEKCPSWLPAMCSRSSTFSALYSRLCPGYNVPLSRQVRTTAPEKYRVKPSNTSCEPGAFVDIIVSLHGGTLDTGSAPHNFWRANSA